jgi:hypothetical protein
MTAPGDTERRRAVRNPSRVALSALPPLFGKEALMV